MKKKKEKEFIFIANNLRTISYLKEILEDYGVKPKILRYKIGRAFFICSLTRSKYYSLISDIKTNWANIETYGRKFVDIV